MDTPPLDAWSLHCLAVFVREESVTRAGFVLGLSQPAASSILARLRKTFDDPLLVKSSSGMVATPRAQELRLQCERLLQDMRAMLETNSGTEPRHFTGTVSIAAVDMGRALLLPRLLPRVAAAAPNVCIRVHEVDRARMHEFLEHGAVDLGVGPSSVSTGRLHYRQLWADRAVLIASRDMLDGVAEIDAEWLCRQPAAAVQISRPSFYDDELDKALGILGMRRMVAVVERSFLMLPLILERGQFVAVVPGRFGRHAVQRYAVSMADCPVELPALNSGMYWHERTHRDSMYRWIRDQISDCARETAEPGKPSPC